MVKKSVGRPKQGRTSPLALRIEPELKTMLNEAKARSGATLTDEVHRRLRVSFNLDQERQKLFDAFGDRKNYACCRLIGNLMIELNKITGKSWTSDAWTFDQLRQGINSLLDRMDPAYINYTEGTVITREKPQVPDSKNPLPDNLGAVLGVHQLAVFDYKEAT